MVLFTYPPFSLTSQAPIIISLSNSESLKFVGIFSDRVDFFSKEDDHFQFLDHS